MAELPLELDSLADDHKLIPLDDVHVAAGRRSLQPDRVSDLAESIRTLGLLSPIGVRWVEGGEEGSDSDEPAGFYRMVFGLHRLAAVRELGWKEIPCRVLFSSSAEALGESHVPDMSDDDRHAWMVEIAENLHRAELTALERAEHIASWLRLKWGVSQAAQASQEAAKRPSAPADAAAKPGETARRPSEAGERARGRPTGGRSAAAREIGVSEPEARRSEKIAALPTPAKEEAKSLGLDDNQAALLRAIASPDPIQALRNHRAETPSPPSPPTAKSASQVHIARLEASGAISAELRATMEAVRGLSPEERSLFLWWVRVVYPAHTT
jgi:ParB-like chromosome segregation protein Spo0J